LISLLLLSTISFPLLLPTSRFLFNRILKIEQEALDLKKVLMSPLCIAEKASFDFHRFSSSFEAERTPLSKEGNLLPLLTEIDSHVSSPRRIPLRGLVPRPIFEPSYPNLPPLKHQNPAPLRSEEVPSHFRWYA